jgi:ribonuclease HI
MIRLQFDGMLRSSRDLWSIDVGLLGYGWSVQRNGIEIAHGFGIFVRKGMAGSNVAEYLALIEGLEALADLRIKDRVEIRGDAKCVIDQMTGESVVSSPLTIELHQRARQLTRRIPAITWVWVPRRENRYADSLSRRSFQYLRSSPHLEEEINNTQLIPLYGGRLVPLLDLRVHAPMLYEVKRFTKRS